MSRRGSNLLCPFQRSFFFIIIKVYRIRRIHMATTCCLVDGREDNPTYTEYDIDTSSYIFLLRRFLFYIFDYPLALAKYSYHVADFVYLSSDTRSPVFFAAKFLFSPTPSLSSTCTSIMRAYADAQSLVSTSFTDYGLRMQFCTTHEFVFRPSGSSSAAVTPATLPTIHHAP